MIKKTLLGLGLLSGLVLIPHALYAGSTRIIDADQLRSGAALLSLPTATQTLVGTSESQTLTNKTLTSPSISTPTGLVKGDVGLGNVDNTSDATKNAASVTLTNKTLTSPVINSPTGIVKGDVGLGNVDNTSDATKNAATVQLTNKDIDGGTASNTSRITIPKNTLANATALTRKEGTIVYATDQAKPYYDNGSSLVAVGSGSGSGSSGYNTITNTDAETDTSGWTESGGTFATTTTSGELLLGAKSFKWTPSAAQNLRSAAVTIPDGLFGRNCYAQVIYKTASTDYTMQVLDGSNNVLASYAMPAASTVKIAPINFVCPTSGTIKLGFVTTASAVFLAFDSAFLGEATNITTSTNVTDWVSAGATIIGATTTAPTKATTRELDNMSWRRVGDSMEIRWSYAAASATGAAAGSGDYLIQIPTGYQIDTSKVTTYTNVEGDGLIGANKSIVGYGWMGHSTENGNVVASVYSSTQVRFFKAVSGHNTSQFISAFESASSSLTLAGLNYNVFMSVPIVGWSAEPAFRPDLAAQSWSGKITSTADWTTTSTSFVDVSVTSASTFTEITNTNFGTVTQYKSGATEYPGFSFTPSVVGNYLVCFSGSMKNSVGSNGTYVKLTDGTTDITQPQESIPYTGGVSLGISNCGILPVTSLSTKNIRIQIRASGGTAGINTGTAVPLGFSITKTSQSFPAPILLGSVTSKSTTAEGLERGYVGTTICSSSPCTIGNASAGISSITRASTGDYTINFASGAFSGPPACVISANKTGIAAANIVTMDYLSTATTMRFQTYHYSTGVLQDTAFSFICAGPK